MEQAEVLPHDEREVVLRAGFHECDRDGRMWVSLRFLRGPRHPVEGETVYLLDGEGRGCLGRVVLVRGWAALVELDGEPG
jgi:hypothetical protein